MSVKHAPSRPMTVLVVDDHQTFADLLEIAIVGEHDLTCVGSAHNVTAGLAKVEQFRPDLVVMDVQLGDGDGVDATAIISARWPEVRVVVLTAHADASLMRRAADAGACCLLPKDGSLPELLTALRTATRGGFVVHPTLLKTLVSDRPRPVEYIPPLSRRESDVLQMLAIGMDVRAIADDLGISLNTCRGYVKSLLSKMNAHSQLEAVAVANRHGLIDAPARR
jgi:DNA-binding NarL/FixJ family response regulator